MLFTLGITLLWSMVKVEHVANVPITPFALTGYSSVLVWRNAVNRCNLAIEPNLSLLFHRNVRVLDIFSRAFCWKSQARQFLLSSSPWFSFQLALPSRLVMF